MCLASNLKRLHSERRLETRRLGLKGGEMTLRAGKTNAHSSYLHRKQRQMSAYAPEWAGWCFIASIISPGAKMTIKV